MMATTVSLIGIVSIVMLLWAERINERLRNDADIVDTIMDLQIHTATSHLWLEQAIGGDHEVNVDNVIAGLDQAIKLADVILVGGKAEHDWISEPLNDPELRARMEAIKPLLAEFRIIALARLQDRANSGLGSHLDRRFDKIFKEILSKTRKLENIIETAETVNHKKSRLLFLGILIIWVIIVIAATTGLWRLERYRKNAEEQLMKAYKQLLSQTEELTEHREHLAEMVERRTTELTAANELLRVEITGHRQAEEMLRETEKQIRQLSSRLIFAQEIERKRISMELHDELGQALNVMKLRIRIIVKGLSKDQLATREECEGLLEYMNHVIEDVRRLSLALSPTILEDLGLTSALRWLISNFTAVQNIKITTDIAEIDHLFCRSYWITVYRVIQEALTNIGKHAEAENVSVVIRRQYDAVIFSVEDDGKGFDLKQTSLKDAPEKGLGLSTMTERIRMMGEILEIESRKGIGTRITFTIPVEQEGE